MAITRNHLLISRFLRDRGQLPRGGSLLEIGEAEWFCDIPFTEIAADLGGLPSPEDRAEAERRIHELHLALIPLMRDGKGAQKPAYKIRTDMAKLYYRIFFDSRDVSTIELKDGCIQQDLNKRFFLKKLFDITVNNGTAEHIFNIANVFYAMHKHTKPNGAMIHYAPFTGMVDHGFFSLHPTLFYDIALANGYAMNLFIETSGEIIEISSRDDIAVLRDNGRITFDSGLVVFFRKGNSHADFVTPMQGVYSGSFNSKQTQSWQRQASALGQQQPPRS